MNEDILIVPTFQGILYDVNSCYYCYLLRLSLVWTMPVILRIDLHDMGNQQVTESMSETSSLMRLAGKKS